MKQRFDHIDIAKGIGILMVIVGHCGSLPSILSRFIFSVHMPLFFILSGYFYVPRPEIGERLFIKKNAKNLLLPYAMTCVFVIALRVLRTILAQGDIFYTFKLWLFASLYGSGTIVPDFSSTQYTHADYRRYMVPSRFVFRPYFFNAYHKIQVPSFFPCRYNFLYWVCND